MNYELNWFWLITAALVAGIIILQVFVGIPGLMRRAKEWIKGENKKLRR